MNKLIILTAAIIGLACFCLFIKELDFDWSLPKPSSVKFNPDVFEDCFRKDVRVVPVSSVEQLSIYRCSRAGRWSMERLERRYGPPVVVTNLNDIEKVLDELHFPGRRQLRNASGRSDVFHMLCQTKAGEIGYARILRNKDIWNVAGNNTIYEINEPSFLISLMTDQPQPPDVGGK